MTVGYGDAVPVTSAGKAVAGIEMLASLLVLALPIAIIGTNFTQVNGPVSPLASLHDLA